jgi:multiple sugar transport system ATP-binding protein
MYVAGFIGSPTMNFIPVTVQGTTARAPGISVELPSAPGIEKAVLGIRPEAMTEKVREGSAASSALGVDGASMLDMAVEVTEILGADQFVYGTVAGDAITARVDPQLKVAPGDHLRLAVDTRRLHLFDPSSGIALL